MAPVNCRIIHQLDLSALLPKLTMNLLAWASRSKKHNALNGVRSCRVWKKKSKHFERSWLPRSTTQLSSSENSASPCGKKSPTICRQDWRMSRRAMCKFSWNWFFVLIGNRHVKDKCGSAVYRLNLKLLYPLLIFYDFLLIVIRRLSRKSTALNLLLLKRRCKCSLLSCSTLEHFFSSFCANSFTLIQLTQLFSHVWSHMCGLREKLSMNQLLMFVKVHKLAIKKFIELNFLASLLLKWKKKSIYPQFPSSSYVGVPIAWCPWLQSLRLQTNQHFPALFNIEQKCFLTSP